MSNIRKIHHVTLVVDNLEAACAFYEEAFGLEALPTFNLDFPAQFYRINDEQQLHLTEWEDSPSFRGHVCMQVEDFNTVFYRMRDQGLIDTAPWGKVRRLPDGAMQMFIRDPSNNLVEISCSPDTPVDAEIFEDQDLVQGVGVYVSNRNDGRGHLRSDDATLYHGQQS
jgi:catechol 2,3-dioxygenase-like lactoylglutathione lyase family enzyme